MRLREHIDPRQLFVGALVQSQEMDTFTAVVTGIHEKTVSMVDVYGWNETEDHEFEDVVPRHIDDYVLTQLFGFVRFVDKTYQLDIESTVIHVSPINQETWKLTKGDIHEPFRWAHQLQDLVRKYYGGYLFVIPPKQEVDEEDEY